MHEVFYGQDGEIIKDEIIKNFTLSRGDTRYKKEDRIELFDFVGFILNEKKMLAVFPKHYFSSEKIDNDIEDIQLLFKTIYQYINTEKSKATANKYMGNDPEFDSDYPFAAFFSIYNYFKQYGIYQEKMVKTTPGLSGKISWKDTIRKSKKIISDGNLIFTPLYVNKKRTKQVFLSECMAFAIDYTLQKFHYFFSLPRTNYNISNFDFFDNKEYVLGQLRQSKNEVFKDIHKKVIQDLIDFFESLDKLKGGDIHIKINYFDKVWEKMVEKYLNDYFFKVDDIGQKLIFNNSKCTSIFKFKNKIFDIDDSIHQFKIILDHYALQDGNQYIFDSKYYTEIKSLDYKQLSYYKLLKYKVEKDKKTYNALILPGEKESCHHFKLADAFKSSQENNIIIMEYYLNVKKAMKNYVQM